MGHIKSYLGFILSVAFLISCSASNTDHKTADLFDPLVETWPHDKSDIAVDPHIHYGVLDNGMRYALRKNALPENEAYLRFRVIAGSKQETDTTLGLAHFLEHMAFNGSQNVPEGEMVKSLERLGLSFGADTNASTSYSRTEYTLTLPEVSDEIVDYALFLMRETADKLLIEPEAVDRERGVVKAEEARGNTPGRKAARAFTNFAYPDAYSTSRPVIGTPETLDAISAEDLRAYYETYYRPERSVLILTGDFDVAEMETKIQTVFGSWSNDNPVPDEPDIGEVNAPGLVAATFHDPELTTTLRLISLSDGTPQRDNLAPREAAAIRSVANALVNQRISKKLLDGDLDVLSAGLSYSQGQLSNNASAFVSAKNDNWKAGIDLVVSEMKSAMEYGFFQSEIDELIANNRRSWIDFVNTSAKRRSGGLASNIAGSFAGGSVITTPESGFERFEGYTAHYTDEKLHTAYKAMWEDFTPLIWVQGPSLDGVTHEMITDHFKTAMGKPSLEPEIRKTQNFAYETFGPTGRVTTQDKIEDFDVITVQFENNARLNMKVTDFEDEWLRLSVSVGEGEIAFPKDILGLSSLASSLPLGGLEAHKASEIGEIFAGKNVSTNMNIGTERINFSTGTNPEDVHAQLQLWTAMITAPGYREEWQTLFQESITSSFHTIDATPDGVAGRDLLRILASGDPRFGLLELDAYMALNLDQVRSALTPVFKDGAIEIGVVGDFNPDEIIDAVAKTFGALPTRRERFAPVGDTYTLRFPAPERVKLTHTGEANLGAKYMTWPITKPWDITTSRHFGMINRIFRNRLIETIREDLGLSYSPASTIRFSEIEPNYGYAMAVMNADPKFFDGFEKATIDIVADLRKGTITEDELNRARQPVIESLERGQKENGSWVGLVSRAQTETENFDYRKSRRPYYETLSAQDLNAVIGELFDPETMHIVEILPESLASQ